MPKGFLTEEGPRPEFAGLYGAKEHPLDGYPARTRANVREDGLEYLMWFGDPSSRGGNLTIRECTQMGVRSLIIPRPNGFITPAMVAEELLERRVSLAMVAGNRESSYPGIGHWVGLYPTEVFRILAEG